MELATVTTAEVRRLLDDVLPTLDDLRAFVMDELGSHEYQRIEGIQNRVQMVNEVLARHRDELPRVAAALERWRRRRLVVQRRLVGRNLLGLSIVGLLILAAVLLGMQSLRQPTEAVPQIIIIQSPQKGDNPDLVQLRQLQKDTPEQFAAKVQRAGLGNVRYQVAPDRVDETQDILRLVLALLKKTDQRISAMEYKRPQIQAWRHDPRPQAKFLAQLTAQIEAQLKLAEPVPLDLGLARDLGIVQSDMGLPPSLKPETQELRPPPLTPRSIISLGRPDCRREVGEAHLSALAAFDQSDYKRMEREIEQLHKLCSPHGGCCGSDDVLYLHRVLGEKFEARKLYSEAMYHYQQAWTAGLKMNSTFEPMEPVRMAINELKAKLGEIIVAKKTRRGCRDETLWVTPGHQSISGVASDPVQIDIEAGQRKRIGSCK